LRRLKNCTIQVHDGMQSILKASLPERLA
jgi:hypothetical protein